MRQLLPVSAYRQVRVRFPLVLLVHSAVARGGFLSAGRRAATTSPDSGSAVGPPLQFGRTRPSEEQQCRARPRLLTRAHIIALSSDCATWPAYSIVHLTDCEAHRRTASPSLKGWARCRGQAVDPSGPAASPAAFQLLPTSKDEMARLGLDRFVPAHDEQLLAEPPVRQAGGAAPTLRGDSTPLRLRSCATQHQARAGSAAARNRWAFAPRVYVGPRLAIRRPRDDRSRICRPRHRCPRSRASPRCRAATRSGGSS